MKQKFIAAAIQLNADNNLARNITHATALIKQAAADGAKFISLPENSFFMRGENEDFPPVETAVSAMQKLSGELKIWLLFCVIVKQNRCILLNPKGEIAAYYDKIHLFDVDVPNGESHRESDSITPGDKALIADLPWTKLGMTICYDLRFPHLFRKLAQSGAEIISVPSAFTFKTGEAHWEILLRARAIENSCYIIAPAQCGTHPRGRRTYGHSLIIDPWGKVVAEASEDKEEVIMAEIDLGYVKQIRESLPSLRHDKKFTI